MASKIVHSSPLKLFISALCRFCNCLIVGGSSIQTCSLSPAQFSCPTNSPTMLPSAIPSAGQFYLLFACRYVECNMKIEIFYFTSKLNFKVIVAYVRISFLNNGFRYLLASTFSFTLLSLYNSTFVLQSHQRRLHNFQPLVTLVSIFLLFRLLFILL